MSLQTRIAALITAIGADIKALQTPGVWTVVRKTADESVSSSITPQDDNHLFFTTVSGASYEIEIFLIYGSPAGAGTPDLLINLGEDATIRGVFAPTGGLTSTDAASASGLLANQTATMIFGTAAADRVAMVKGVYQGAGGVFRLKWAQGSSGINATIVRTASVLRYRRIQ